MIFRDDVTDLMTPIYDEAMLETYDMLKKVCEKLFYIQDDDSKQVDTTGVSGLGQWTATPEGTAITQEDIVQMYNESFVHTKYANAFKVTDEAMEDDEYALISKVETAEEMGKGAVVQQERMCADIFNLHTTTAGADEVALVDAAHPKNPNESGTTYDNELTGASSALSHESIEDMDILIAGNLKDPKGILVPRPVRGCLLVPPALFGTARRLVSERAWERPGTPEREINVYAGAYQVEEWRYLDASTTAWWIVYPELKGLRYYWRRRPHFDSYYDPTQESYVFNGKMRASVGWTGEGWRTVWGSVGA